MPPASARDDAERQGAAGSPGWGRIFSDGWWGYAVLAVVLVLAATVRVQQLGIQSMLHWDEGLFVTGAEFLTWRVSEPSAAPDLIEGYPVFNEKPFHVVVLAVVGAVWKLSPETGRWISALFGLAAVVLVAFRLLRLPGLGLYPAVLAALALGGSTYHVYYSRLGLHETHSVFWLLLGLSLFDRPEALRRPLVRGFLAGVLGGLCLGSSYRWLPLLPLLALRTATGRWRRPGEKWLAPASVGRVGASLLVFALGLLTVVLLLEGLYRFAFEPHFTLYQPASYVAALQSKFSRETVFTADAPFFFLELLLGVDGLLFVVLLLGVLGLGLSGRGRGCASPIPLALRLEVLALVLIPLGLFSAAEAKMARAVSVISPWLALAGGLMGAELRSRARTQQGRTLAGGFVALLVVGSLLSGGNASRLPDRLQSGYPEALRYVTERSPRHLTSQSPLSAAWLGRQAVVRYILPRRRADLIEAIDEGARYLILDWEKYLWYSPLLAGLEEHLTPVLRLPNPCVDFLPLLHETYLPEDVRSLREQHPDVREVLVYDLGSLRRGLGGEESE